MNREESKTPLVLMEQVIMVLVFALVAALCIQAFALARTLSVRMVERDHAWNMSQTFAETMKAYGGDMEAVCDQLGGEIVGDQGYLYFDGEWKIVEKDLALFELVFTENEGNDFCKTGEIMVTDISGKKEIVSLEIAWQGAKADE